MASTLSVAQTDALLGVYRKPPMEFVRGSGVELFDANGRAYLDFVAGIATVSLGHCHCFFNTKKINLSTRSSDHYTRRTRFHRSLNYPPQHVLCRKIKMPYGIMIVFSIS